MSLKRKNELRIMVKPYVASDMNYIYRPDRLGFYERKQHTYMKNTLIVYYSLFQNTKNLALEIAKQTGGSLRELVLESNYFFDYNTAAKEVRNQITQRFCPKLVLGNEPIYEINLIVTWNKFLTRYMEYMMGFL